VLRTCDGTDPNLTRRLPADRFDPATMVLSPWNMTAEAGEVVTQCGCGLVFDDVYRMVCWPHEFIGQQTLIVGVAAEHTIQDPETGEVTGRMRLI
jgi:hypothetical protein